MRSVACLAALLACAGVAHAEDVVFYRCTDAHGGLTLQNQPCPKGMRQEKKIMQGVGRAPASVPSAAPAAAAPSPAPGAASATTAAPAATAAAAAVAPSDPPPTPPTPATDAAPRLPPPPLYACVTREQQRYVGEVAEPTPRCVPLRTVGLDGSPDKAGGSACEVIRDRCEALPEAGACDAWTSYVAEAETHWRFAVPDHAEQLRQEFLRRQQLFDASSCGAPK
ncbi:DUF4124 domain-containing protein [Xanthomonas sp. WHRI 7945]|nr:DUF4124 domain-containing protein [Xanthomonas campestris pv. campestris]